MNIRAFPYTLRFTFDAGTSRGVLREKTSWFIYLQKDDKHYLGECGLLKGLSIDDRPSYVETLERSIEEYKKGILDLRNYSQWPSIVMGWETLMNKLQFASEHKVFDSSFIDGRPIDINGLVWMGDKEFMHELIQQKLEQGFTCIKMKIGAIDFQEELRLLKSIRTEYNSEEIELRVDANGAFAPSQALDILKTLSELEIHSIEQPIASGQWQEMARLCEESPLDIALDEELIPISDSQDRRKMMETIRPQYIILKPSLIGGFKSADQWIELAGQVDSKWWATSALESNIGLSAIAQWCASKGNSLPQGLGTGSLYFNNVDSPLVVEQGEIRYDKDLLWNFQSLLDAQ